MTRPSLLVTVAAAAAVVVAGGLLAGPVVGRHASLRSPSSAPVDPRAVPVDGIVPMRVDPSAEVARVAVEFTRAVSEFGGVTDGPADVDLRGLATPELVSALATRAPVPRRPLSAAGRPRLIEVRTAVLPRAEVAGRPPTARVLLVGRLTGNSTLEPAAQPHDVGDAGAVPLAWQLDLVATPAGWRVTGVRP